MFLVSAVIDEALCIILVSLIDFRHPLTEKTETEKKSLVWRVLITKMVSLYVHEEIDNSYTCCQMICHVDDCMLQMSYPMQ